ncbi:hypothetical protein NPIL_292661 [Nephila pilipes]|uniref:Uncharacterized protein n=1 Tax=Nephila pilipes TaxID=299642 RepID=A0A8X6MC44_NEPPI|nr:hypothetical protein NPIL_292661 [Nephila pilipes]
MSFHCLFPMEEVKENKNHFLSSQEAADALMELAEYRILEGRFRGGPDAIPLDIITHQGSITELSWKQCLLHWLHVIFFSCICSRGLRIRNKNVTF